MAEEDVMAQLYVQPSPRLVYRGMPGLMTSQLDKSQLLQNLKAQTEAKRKKAEFEKANVQLGTGEWVSREQFNQLTPEDQALLSSVGVDPFVAQKRTEFEKANVQLGTGEWVSREQFNQLAPEDQQILQSKGIDQFRAQKEAEYQSLKSDFEAKNVKLDVVDAEGNPEYVSREAFEKLTPSQQADLRRLGVEAFNARMQEAARIASAGVYEGGYSPEPASAPPAEDLSPTPPQWSGDPSVDQQLAEMWQQAERQAAAARAAAQSTGGQPSPAVSVAPTVALSEDPMSLRKDLVDALRAAKGMGANNLAADLEQKLNYLNQLQQARASGTSTPEFEASIAQAVSPFTHFGQTDYIAATRAGVDLRQWGVPEDVISEVNNRLSAEKELRKAFRGGLPQTAEELQKAYNSGLGQEIARVYGQSVLDDVVRRLQAEYKQREIGVLTEGVPQPKQLSPQERREYDSATARDRFMQMLKAGYIPADSVYAGADSAGNPMYYTGRQADVMRTLEQFKDNPYMAVARGGVSVDDLVSVGYSRTDAQRIAEAVDTARRTGVALPGEGNYISRWNQQYAQAEEAFNAVADRIDAEHPELSPAERGKLLEQTPEYQRLAELNRLNPDVISTELALAKRAAITIGSAVAFSPARILLPEVKASDISGMEWAVGGAQLVLLALPAVGILARGATGAAAVAARGVEAGIQGGATVIFTKDTIDNWSTLRQNPAHLAFALAMDALIAGGALRSISPQMMNRITARATSVMASVPRTVRTLGAEAASAVQSQKGGIIPGTAAGAEGELVRLRPLTRSMKKIGIAISEGDVESIKRNAQEMLKWAQHNPDDPVAVVANRRATDFLRHADDYVRLKDVQPATAEGPLPREAIEARRGVAGNLEALNSLDSYLRQAGLPELPAEHPLSKRSIQSRLKAAAREEGIVRDLARMQEQLREKYRAEVEDRLFAMEIERLKAEAAKDPLSKTNIRKKLQEKDWLDRMSATYERLREATATRLRAEQEMQEFEQTLSELRARAEGDPMSRLNVRRRMKDWQEIQDRVAGYRLAAERTRRAQMAEEELRRFVAEMERLKAEASGNPLSRYSVRRRLQERAAAEVREQAFNRAIEAVKRRAAMEEELKRFEQQMAELKALAEKDPLSRYSVRERLQAKQRLDAQQEQYIKAIRQAQEAYRAEREAVAYADMLKQMEAEAAKDPLSRYSIRRRLGERARAAEQERRLLSQLEEVKHQYDTASVLERERKLQEKIDAMADREATERITGRRTQSPQKPADQTTTSSWTQEDEAALRRLEEKQAREGRLEGEDLIDYERLREKYRTTREGPPAPEEPIEGATERPDSDRGGGGTAVKERTRVKTEERTVTEVKTETGVEEKPDTGVSEKTKTGAKTETGEKTGTKTEETSRAKPGERTVAPLTQPELEPVTSVRIATGEAERRFPRVIPLVNPRETPLVLPEEGTAPLATSYPESSPEMAPQPAPSPAPTPTASVAPESAPEPEPVPLPEPVPEPEPAPNPIPAPVPAPGPVPVPQPRPLPEPEPGRSIGVATKEVVRTPKARVVRASPAGQLIPLGSIAWAQGGLMQGRGVNRVFRPRWYYIPPPYDQNDAIPLDGPPHGARNIDSMSPYETIQIIGKPRAKVPALVTKDLGWIDIEIHNGTEIRYRSKGERTNVGGRLDSPTVGMDINNPAAVAKGKGTEDTTASEGSTVRLAGTTTRPTASMPFAPGTAMRPTASSAGQQVGVPEEYVLPDTTGGVVPAAMARARGKSQAGRSTARQGKAAARKKRSLSWYDRMTTLKGFRV